MSHRVCTVIITYNRKDLLRQCLQGVLTQQVAPLHTLVVNNASSDGTLEMLAQEFPQVEVLTLSENTGVAGGIHYGLKAALAKDCNWFWLLDDDCEPYPDTLAKLLMGLETVGLMGKKTPAILMSRAIWNNRKIHPLNIFWPDIRWPRHLWETLQYGYIAIRWATYASGLYSREAILKYGLPVPEYFLWNDDVEWTGAILRREYGYWIWDSLVLHKTASDKPPAFAIPERFYLEVRNRLWMLRTNSWGILGKIAWGWHLFAEIIHFLLINRAKGWAVIKRGWQDGTGPLPGSSRP